MEAAFRPTRHQIPPLDGLRAIAVLLVMWAHLPAEMLGKAGKVLLLIFQPGYFGVDIFFVLSGFLITRILFHSKEAGKPVGEFLVRRFARIFPIYYLTILVVAFIAPGMYLVWCALYLSNFSLSFDLSPNAMRHTWSLCVEEHFYLVWPFLVYRLKPLAVRNLSWWLVGIAFALAIAITAYPNGLPYGALIYRTTPFRMASLAVGALLAYHEGWLWENKRKMVGLACGGFVLAAMILGPAGAFDTIWRSVMKKTGFLLASTGVFLLGIASYQTGSIVENVLSKKFLPYVGRISYGLYLYHHPIYYFMGILREPGQASPSIAKVALAVVLTFIVATLSFYFIEKPILDWVGRRKKPAATPA